MGHIVAVPWIGDGVSCQSCSSGDEEKRRRHIWSGLEKRFSMGGLRKGANQERPTVFLCCSLWVLIFFFFNLGWAGLKEKHNSKEGSKNNF